MAFSQKLLPELKVSVSGSLLIILPLSPSLSIPLCRLLGRVRKGGGGCWPSLVVCRLVAVLPKRLLSTGHSRAEAALLAPCTLHIPPGATQGDRCSGSKERHLAMQTLLAPTAVCPPELPAQWWSLI